MALSPSNFLNFFLIFSFSLCTLSLTSLAANNNNDTDRLSLLAFKSQITDDPLQATLSWTETVPFCLWQGVTCSNNTTPPRVTTLSLPSCKLGGTLSPAITNLTFLERLDLSGNFLTGSVPVEIGRLLRLQYLLLSENGFVGEIPVNLSRCTQLRVFNMNRNNLTGKIPDELSKLPYLIALHVSANQLTGGIPPVLGNISTLRNLSIAQNHLGGFIPNDLGRLAKLEFLQVASNNLIGTIPPSLFNLSKMTIFAVTFNRLEGTLPPSIGNTYPNLKQLLVGVNSFSGMIPPSLSNASTLQRIDLPDNQFTGNVPIDLGMLVDLLSLNIGRNMLGRGDPDGLKFIDSLTNCTKLQRLGFDSNLFSGSLPSTIANLSITTTEFLSGGNRLSGSIPSGITRLVNLRRLNIGLNNFSGSIPTDIGKLYNLGEVYMNQNMLSGTIPSSISNLTVLSMLRLDGNLLEGSIPSEVGNCQKLQLLNLSDNNLNGIVPLPVFSLSSLTLSLNLARNSLNGSLPDDIGNFVNLKELDLSGNKFSGDIPSGLGRCLSLEHLYLQRNTLNGSIPSSLIALKAIQDIDLSHNNLTGKIPEFFQDFVFLQDLNLSFNQFNGQVPSKGIFSISGASLDGNGDLCVDGRELELKFKLPMCSTETRRRSFYLRVIIGVVCGVLGSAAVLCIVIYCVCKRSRRELSTTFPERKWSSDFSYRELHKATDGFSSDNIIGVGGFASVYKGKLSKEEKHVAVKVLKVGESHMAKMYLAECEASSNIKHRNLVKVLGCCADVDSAGHDFRAIVLEYMPNGALEEWLHPSHEERIGHFGVLDRLNAAIDVACALEYLHYNCHDVIIHCDLKPSNVLLDGDMCAHLSDFGLAKFVREHAEASLSQPSSVGIRGSIGYVAPEYGMGSAASTAGDVYSFGILVLEMVTGKRPTDEMYGEGMSLRKLVKRALSTNALVEIVDSRVDSKIDGKKIEDEECVRMMLRIGVECSSRLPQTRMNMKQAHANLTMIKNKYLGGIP